MEPLSVEYSVLVIESFINGLVDLVVLWSCSMKEGHHSLITSNSCDIANKPLTLGTQIPEERLVKKALRSLSTTFAHKVVSINETKDFNVIKLKELMVSQRTIEIELEEYNKEEKKTLGF